MQKKNLEYKIFRENVMSREMARISCEISSSKDFELDDLSHVVLKGTKTPVGYIGDDTLELINPNKKEFAEYHNKLKGIFNYMFKINNN